jgi:hypothetical protein
MTNQNGRLIREGNNSASTFDGMSPVSTITDTNLVEGNSGFTNTTINVRLCPAPVSTHNEPAALSPVHQYKWNVDVSAKPMVAIFFGRSAGDRSLHQLVRRDQCLATFKGSVDFVNVIPFQ